MGGRARLGRCGHVAGRQWLQAHQPTAGLPAGGGPASALNPARKRANVAGASLPRGAALAEFWPPAGGPAADVSQAPAGGAAGTQAAGDAGSLRSCLSARCRAVGAAVSGACRPPPPYARLGIDSSRARAEAEYAGADRPLPAPEKAGPGIWREAPRRLGAAGQPAARIGRCRAEGVGKGGGGLGLGARERQLDARLGSGGRDDECYASDASGCRGVRW